jgi:hypothetical protein
MFIQELKQLIEMQDTYTGSHASSKDERDVIDGVLDNVEHHLPHSARYKRYDVNEHKKTIYWVTQESSPRESQMAADEIAQQLAHANIHGWTVKVVLRDLYRGDEDHETPWQTAFTDHFMPEHDDDDEPHINPQHFKPLHSEEEFEALDQEGRHIRVTRRFNHEVGRLMWIQPDGTDMPITAVWYNDHGVGSAALTMKITDIHDYLQADPFNPTKDRNHMRESLDEAVGKKVGFVGPFTSSGSAVTDANGKTVCAVNASDKLGPARANERKKIASIIAKALNTTL